MQIPTHILSGWCAANLFPTVTPKQRLFCIIATTIPDLDGLSILGGQESYWHWHHRICHNLPFGILVALLLAIASDGYQSATNSAASLLPRDSSSKPTRHVTAVPTWRLFLLYLSLFQLHLVMDVFGSGPGWGIFYFWPFSNWMFDNSPYSWEFFSWENISIAAALLVWTIAIAIRLGRTPLEYLMPNLDRQLIALLRRPVSAT
jgi:hypothetical protein